VTALVIRRASLTTGAAALLSLALAYGAARQVLDADLVDDAYIFLRYAVNVAEGNGPVFNPGERVEGYTSPLWLALLVIPAAARLDLAVASRWMGASFGLATLALLFVASRRRLPGTSLLPPLFLATTPAFVYWTWAGMETALFTFLFLAAFLAFLREVEGSGGMGGTGACFALALLARPDMAALLPVYLAAIALLVRPWRTALPWKLATFLAPLALPALHLAWRRAFYGSFLPNTYWAKVGVPSTSLLEAGIRYTIHFALAYQLPLWGTVVLAALLLDGTEGRRARVRLLGFGLAVAATWLAATASVGGDHFGMFRLFVPLLPLLALTAGVAVEAILPARPIAGWKRGVLTAAALATVLLLNGAIYVYHGGSRGREEVALARAWAEVGRWLRRNVPPETTVASVMVGAIPYESGLRTLDLVGLTEAHIAQHGLVRPTDPVGHQKRDTEYVLTRRPDLIVFQSSGLHFHPIHPGGKVPPGQYPLAFEDLVNDPRTRKLYRYQAVRLPDGHYFEMLQRKKGSGGE